MKLVAAMSGGVDSAVAAARMVEAGHQVVGVYLVLGHRPETVRDADDALRAASVIGIPLEVWDLTEQFHRDVVDYFLAEYRQGRTPNPCLRCNRTIKFSALQERALAGGYAAIVTGHYADLRPVADGVELHRAADPEKDQSYVLGVLTQHQLRHAIFPLADATKSDVRAEATDRGLLLAGKPDSTDICFIPDGDTAGYLRRHLGTATGVVVDETGTVIGQHQGCHQFTIGQRRGLHLGRPAADGRPRYVTGITPETNTVTMGPKEALPVRSLFGADVTCALTSPRTESWAGLVQVRAHGAAMPALIETTDDGLLVTLQKPAGGIAPGQTMVCYDGTLVVGSATIKESER